MISGMKNMVEPLRNHEVDIMWYSPAQPWDAYSGAFEKEGMAKIRLRWLLGASGSMPGSYGYYVLKSSNIFGLKDFKGKKIRASGKPVEVALAKLGASPQSIALAEAIAAMQTGVIDGQVWSFRAALTYKIQDVVHYVSFWPFYGAESVTIVNKIVFNKLPPDVQKIVEDVSREVEKDLIENVLLGGDKDIEEMKATGKMTFLKPDKDAVDKARDICRPIWDDWANKVKPDGPEAIASIKKALSQ